MTEKIRLTKEQSECINYLNIHFYDAFDDIVHRHLNDGWSNIAGLGALNKLSLKELATALIVGYEVKLTEREFVAEFQNMVNTSGGYYRGCVEGILLALEQVGIKIKGINE